LNPRPEVLIVGAGPAGAAAAILLAEQGFEVTVLDRARFPRDKVCGDGLAPRSVGVLRRLGVEERLTQAGHRPLGEYRIVSTWGDSIKAGLPSYGKGPPYAYVIPRREFDALLVERAREAGAEVIEGRRADRLIPGTAAAPAVETEDDGGRRIVMRPRVVVAADGSRGSFSRTVIPSRHLQPFAVAMRQYLDGAEGLDGALSFFLDQPMLPGYGWAFPASREGGPANVGAGMAVSALRRRGLKVRQVMDWFLGPESRAFPYLAGGRPVGPPAAFPLLIDFPRGRRRREAVLLVGDAGNLIDPLSGEGIGYALESSVAAARAIAASLHSGDLRELAGYERSIWKELGPEFLGAYALRQFLQQPWGNGGMVRLIERDEALARGGMGVLSNTVPATWLLRPGLWRKILAPSRVRATINATWPAWERNGGASGAPTRSATAPR